MIGPTLEDHPEPIFTIKIQSPADKQIHVADEDEIFEEISLAETSGSSSSNMSSTRDSISSSCSCSSSSASQSDSASSQPFFVESCLKIKRKSNLSRYKVKFHEQLVTGVREIHRVTLVEKYLLYYTDEDMHKFREEYREILRKSVVTETPNTLLSMFTNIFCDDEQLCIENDICSVLTSAISFASNRDPPRIEAAPSYEKKNAQGKKKRQKKRSSKSSKSIAQKQKPLLIETAAADSATNIDLYDVLYMY